MSNFEKIFVVTNTSGDVLGAFGSRLLAAEFCKQVCIDTWEEHTCMNPEESDPGLWMKHDFKSGTDAFGFTEDAGDDWEECIVTETILKNGREVDWKEPQTGDEA